MVVACVLDIEMLYSIKHEYWEDAVKMKNQVQEGLGSEVI